MPANQALKLDRLFNDELKFVDKEMSNDKPRKEIYIER